MAYPYKCSYRVYSHQPMGYGLRRMGRNPTMVYFTWSPSHGHRRMGTVAWVPSHVVVSQDLTSNNGTSQRTELYLAQILQKTDPKFSRWLLRLKSWIQRYWTWENGRNALNLRKNRLAGRMWPAARIALYLLGNPLRKHTDGLVNF